VLFDIREYNKKMNTQDVIVGSPVARRLPVGAEVLPEGGVHFRIWAPQHKKVEVVLEPWESRLAAGSPLIFKLIPERNGYFSGAVSTACDGWRYRYRLDEKSLFPDPASRFQPDGPFGPSQIVDPNKFPWTDQNWPGLSLEGQVIYEMHVGTFTSQGNWKGALDQLGKLSETGITAVEVMPVADFAGTFGWGYDGVDLFAPTRLYGRPDDFRLFVDKAHSLGIGVVLDVVYNHLGPAGNYLKQYSESYFTQRYKGEWGEAINFDGPDSGPVREFFITNAGYWIAEFHLDGLRLDATHQVFDKSREHILSAISRQVRQVAGPRKTLLIAENEPQEVKVVRPFTEGGYGLDGIWNDDFHHAAMVVVTHHNEGCYSEFGGSPQEFISCLKWGFLYQGQLYKWQRRHRGTPCLGLKPAAFVLFLQNHDQIANSARGLRLHQLTSPGLFRAVTAVLLLAPGTPLLFQGQEFAASSPFFYFSNVSPALAESIHQSRLKFLGRFRSLGQPEMQARIPRPDDRMAFDLSKLNWDERELHAKAHSLHRDLLKMRREDPVFRSQRSGGLDGAVISPEAFILRFFGDAGDDRLMIVNLGRDLHFDPAPEPLLAAPERRLWQLLWSSESPAYGGSGTLPLETEDNWRIPGQTTVILTLRSPNDFISPP
jgi:maltooligosyltrehalose trehalohydrolase